MGTGIKMGIKTKTSPAGMFSKQAYTKPVYQGKTSTTILPCYNSYYMTKYNY
jgi:hypothetical protein